MRKQSIEKDLDKYPAAWAEAKALFEKDASAGFQALRVLAEQGSFPAMLDVGRAYARGEGTEKDSVLAEKWLKNVAGIGSVRGHYYLGRLYLRSKRYHEARDEFSFSAVRGFSPALHDLGKLYLLGLGVEKNLDRAEYYLKEAAAAGSVFGKRLLARVMVEKSPSLLIRVRSMLLIVSSFVDLGYVLFTQGYKSERLIE